MNIADIERYVVEEVGVAVNREWGNYCDIPPEYVNVCNGADMQQRVSEIAGCISWFIDKQKNGEKLDNYLEVGTCAGGVTKAFNHYLNFKSIVLVDDAGASNKAFFVDKHSNWKRSEVLGFLKRIEIIGNSNDIKTITAAKNLGIEFDILFIDAGHEYIEVKRDTVYYSQLVREGGYVIFHDSIGCPGVSLWLEELEAQWGKISRLNRQIEFAFSGKYTLEWPEGMGLRIYRKEVI